MFNIWKFWVTYTNMLCKFQALQANIFAKTKNFAKLFKPVVCSILQYSIRDPDTVERFKHKYIYVENLVKIVF